MADGGVDLGGDRGARNLGAQKVGVSPGEITIARKTVVPRTNSNEYILDYNCIITRLKY